VSTSSVPALIDTNVLLRYITGDPPALAGKAARIIDAGEPLLLSELILVEAAYVLASVYQVRRPAIVDALSLLVQKQNIQCVGLPKTLVLTALDLCRESKRHSFTDAFLWAQARNLGTRVYSFDRRLPTQGVAILDVPPTMPREE
jgi:predicted nucleic acid-binding protein